LIIADINEQAAVAEIKEDGERKEKSLMEIIKTAQ
jgi:hypothetical protein